MRLNDIDLSPAMLALARSGDEAALGAFYAACARPAYTLIRRIVPGPAAEDLLQEAFLDAFRGLPSFRGEVPLGAWFRRIVVHRCYRHVRSPWQRSRAWLEELLEAGDERGVAAAPAAGLGLDLERALERLAPAARLVVWLHDVEGYTHEEIATLTARTPSYSKSQLARAHARLRDWLEPAPAAPAACAVEDRP